VCCAKVRKKGGLGIEYIWKMDISLLSKWWWKLETEDGIWQTLVTNKYIKNWLVSTIPPRLDDSPVGKDLLKFKHIYLAGKKVEAQDGENAIFSLDC